MCRTLGQVKRGEQGLAGAGADRIGSCVAQGLMGECVCSVCIYVCVCSRVCAGGHLRKCVCVFIQVNR